MEIIIANDKRVSLKFGNFRENFIFASSDKRHICDVKTSRHWHGRRQSDCAISRGFHFHENENLAKISEFTVLSPPNHTLCASPVIEHGL